MKVKSKRKMAGILAAVLIALVLLAFDCINGDPISERWAMHRAIQFAEKLYPDQTFTAENAGSMRGFCYTTRVQSQQSKDTWFYVETHFWLFTSDIYTIDHTQYIDARLNTSNRMELEAQDEVAPVLVDALSEYDIPYDEAEQCVMVIRHMNQGKMPLIWAWNTSSGCHWTPRLKKTFCSIYRPNCGSRLKPHRSPSARISSLPCKK